MTQEPTNTVIETELFRDLKLITTLLIKNGSKLYRHLLPLVQAYEDKSWLEKSETEKTAAFRELKTQCTGEGEINRFFEEFPHDWTRRKFSECKEKLNLTCPGD